MIIECRYKLSGDDIIKFESCAANAVIDEHEGAISVAFRDIDVTIEVDDEWGFCKIIAVNGHRVID